MQLLAINVMPKTAYLGPAASAISVTDRARCPTARGCPLCVGVGSTLTSRNVGIAMGRGTMLSHAHIAAKIRDQIIES